CEVMTLVGSGFIATINQTQWYKLSFRFDSTFPMNHASICPWALINQFFSVPNPATSPPLSIHVSMVNGMWSFVCNRQNGTGGYLDNGEVSLFNAPIVPGGPWNDVILCIHWSDQD